MGWFKDLLGTSNWQTAAPTTTAASGPLGMAQGKGVRFDTTLALLLEGSTSVRVPFDQAVWSAGWVDLGQSNKLHRYYMNDEDFWGRSTSPAMIRSSRSPCSITSAT